MDLVLAAVLASMEADKVVAEAIKDSSCAECKKFHQQVTKSVDGCKSCGQVSNRPSMERLSRFRSFRIRSKGGCCGG